MEPFLSREFLQTCFRNPALLALECSHVTTQGWGPIARDWKLWQDLNSDQPGLPLFEEQRSQHWKLHTRPLTLPSQKCTLTNMDQARKLHPKKPTLVQGLLHREKPIVHYSVLCLRLELFRWDGALFSALGKLIFLLRSNKVLPSPPATSIVCNNSLEAKGKWVLLLCCCVFTAPIESVVCCTSDS